MPPAWADGRGRAANPNRVGSLHRNAGTLGHDEVAVWWLATEASTPADWRRWLLLLDHDERQRAARFGLELDRREFIAAHALLRTMLAFYLARPAAAWRFCADAEGKPAVAAETASPACQFNISHTRGLVTAAVATHGRIGIDVERIDETKADFSVAETYFAPSEVALLQSMPESQRPVWFFRLWTLKEAYLKAIGTGLGAPLQSFAFDFNPIRISFASGGDDPNRWHFAMLPAGDQHVLSLAIDRSSGTVRVVPRAVAAQDI